MSKVISLELEQALKEIGSIEPWWSEDDELFVFEHDAYPMVMAAEDDKETTIESYKRALTEFIKERLDGNIADFVDEMTSGRGGARPGAGRPRQPKKIRKYVPEDIAPWLDREENIAKIRELMKA